MTNVQHNIEPYVKEFLKLTRELEPLLARQEVLKNSIREFGPGSYPCAPYGMVKVSAPSESKLKGTEMKLTNKFSSLPAKEQAKLQSLGVVELVNVWSRASTSRVEAVLT